MRHGWPEIATVALCLVLCVTANGQKPPPSEPYIDLSRLEIVGAESFPADEIRETLLHDFEIYSAAHPLAELSELPGVINERLLAGYRSVGFADAQVKTDVDLDNLRLVTTIVEGSRYRNGTVKVENSTQVNAEQLQQQLADRSPPKEAVEPVFESPESKKIVNWNDREGKKVDWVDPTWPAGGITKFDLMSQLTYRNAVERALQDLGYQDARFIVKLQPDRETQLVAMNVRFKQEPKPATLQQIVIYGNQRDTDQAILSYLKLEEGELFTRHREAKLKFDLWRSGRYISSELKLTETTYQQGKKLSLTLLESPYAPPLNEPLSKEEQLLLSVGRNLANPDTWPTDMLVNVTMQHIELSMVTDPHKGIVITTNSAGSDLTKATSLVASGTELGIYRATDRLHYSAPAPNAGFMALVNYRLNNSPKREDSPYNISFGLGMKTKPGNMAQLPFRFELNVTPACCISHVHARDTKSHWEQGNLILKSSKESLEVNGSTGQLVWYRIGSGEYQLDIEFREGAYAKRIEELHKLAAPGHNAYDATRPLRSTAQFLLREEMLNDWLLATRRLTTYKLNEAPDSLRTLAAFIDLGLLDPFDTKLVSAKPKPEAERRFSLARPVIPPGELSEVQRFARWLVPYVDDMFARHTWPWIASRETGFTLAGRGTHANTELTKAYKSETHGPLVYLVVASLLDRVNHRYAVLFADRGKLRLSLEEFRHDYLQLLQEDTLTRRSIYQTCENLRLLEEQKLRDLQTQVPLAWRPAFQAFAEKLRSDTQQPLEQAIPSALDAAWDAGLREQIEQLLNRIAEN